MIAVCLKWVPRRPIVDPLTGGVDIDPRSAGASEADLAALEAALLCCEAWDDELTAVTLGPPEAESVLRVAIAAGARHAIRIETVTDLPSELVAATLAHQIREARVVWCGAVSLDRGSGSVPAYIAARLEAEQALGLIEIRVDGRNVRAVRRLDGGRRERLVVRPPAVLSVEGAAVRLRRADLPAAMAARRATILTVPGPAHEPVVESVRRPFRPRPRVLAAPGGATARERISAILSAGTSAGAGARRVEPVHLTAEDAADRILTALREWGYRPGP